MNRNSVMFGTLPIVAIVVAGVYFSDQNKPASERPSKQYDTALLEKSNSTRVAEPQTRLQEKTLEKANTVEVTGSPATSRKTSQSETDEELTILGLQLSSDTSQFELSDYEKEISTIREFITSNDVMNKLNNLEIAEADLPQYVELISHLTRLRTEDLQKRSDVFGQKVDEYAQIHPALVQSYKQGDFNDTEKFSAQNRQDGIDKINERFDLEQKRYETEDDARNKQSETL